MVPDAIQFLLMLIGFFWRILWENITNAVPFFTLCVIVVGLIVSYLQLIRISRASTAASYVEIFKFLQEDGMREARHHLIKELEPAKKKYDDWSDEDRMMAEKACGAYDVLAGKQLLRITGRDFFKKKWRYSIIKSWTIAEPMIRKHREERGPDYWSDFELIYKKAKKEQDRIEGKRN